MRRHNSGGKIPDVPKKKLTMEDYDKLPKEYRDILKYMALKLDFTQGALNYSIPKIIEIVRAVEKNATLATYGPDHPQA